jgi:geranylgeranyl pyrophosphate synthase
MTDETTTSEDAVPKLAREGMVVAIDEPEPTNQDIIEQLGAGPEIARLRARIARWLAEVDPELREPLCWAFDGPSKFFRPLTVFACRRAIGEAVDADAVELAFAIELAHNMSLIVDDILDESDERRGVPTVERHFGRLHALMASGYITADAFDTFAEEPSVIHRLAELLRRLGAAECLQWRLRRQPLGVHDWHRIAGEDTGSMFEIAAVFGAGSERLRRYGHLLGVLYHGCDDVGDQRGLNALGGGGEEDIRDGILTLPAALAIRDPEIRALFTRDDDDPKRLAALGAACRTQLDDAEAELNRVAQAARDEAHAFALDPEPLIALVGKVRQLSRR